MRKQSILALILFLAQVQAWAQRPVSREVRWLRVGALHSTFAIEGAEFEMHRTGALAQQNDGMRWPADFRYQDNCAAKSLWIGCTNFKDPVTGDTYPYKVVAAGPRTTNILNEMMPVQFKLVGRFPSPTVIVDGESASENMLLDVLDDEQPDLEADRVVDHILHTSIGITVHRRMMAFAQEYHDNYFIYEYVFKNTGIIDTKGTRIEQTLTGVIFHLQFRWAFANEPFMRGGGWIPAGNISWGRNAMNDAVGMDPTAAGFEFAALFSWYGHHSQSVVDDWGAPHPLKPSPLGAPQYIGMVTLHADKSATDKSHDPYQPRTTQYLASDASYQANNQYDAVLMANKYAMMSAGHPPKTHAQEVGDGNADQWGTDAGGYASAAGYGPYTLAPGDSIRIVIAECVAGISRQKSLEVGTNWFNDAKPFVLPNGAVTNDRNEYKKAWVITGKDSLFQTFRRAMANFKSGYKIPQAPPPPKLFQIKSGGNRITLTWDNSAESWPTFDGYEIYRAIARPDTFYQKIFECSAANVVNTFNDETAVRGFDYYYYIQTKDNGSTNDIKPGVPLRSSRFFTMTNKPAYLRRPAKDDLAEIRVVPNPYHIEARDIQFGRDDGADRLAFYGLPPECTIRIYTERGDLVDTIEHNDGSGDELWHSLTSSRQIVVSGLYIAHFQTPDGRSTYRKFVIIR
ncbi:MAG: hypothetical protein ONB24_06605 [candidate division KSB1 bacterium]|nr:hypothetical protein [candidate division KSB1 bacterium]